MRETLERCRGCWLGCNIQRCQCARGRQLRGQGAKLEYKLRLTPDAQIVRMLNAFARDTRFASIADCDAMPDATFLAALSADEREQLTALLNKLNERAGIHEKDNGGAR